MIYYLADWLRLDVGVFRVFTYNTVRAGGAAFTAFVLALMVGPAVIRWLRALKVGQFIRKEHVEDLHALHKGKAGTPTMGGALILLTTAAATVLWGQVTNRLLLLALGVFCALGLVGFLDDYVKLRRKHNKGLSAKAKFAGQIIVGLLLGTYLVANPITVSATHLSEHDVADWPGFIGALKQASQSATPSAAGRFFERLPEDIQKIVTSQASAGASAPASDEATRARIVEGVNQTLARVDVYDAPLWEGLGLNGESAALFSQGLAALSPRELVRFNRILLEAAFPKVVARSVRQLHTKVEVPILRQVLIPFGVFYVLFVLLIIVGASNAVNLTDGLDGLAIGASICSLLAYTGIAYVVSRADWSDYLLLIYVPEASELPVFGAALVGAGMGFLWFNCHPAEVFMGDTGSLALGGVLGTMAILTKQELLLPVVGGLFVVEASSVLIQIASFQLLGKRVFKMAPIHHHFELKGWSESKVTIRFWILALVFALMSLATLKVR